VALIGYTRVSTRDQDFASQQEALVAAGCKRIFSEKISGSHAQRPELLRLLDYIRAGDAVVVTRLDRLARNTGDLLRLAETLLDKQAGLRSLAEPWADTTSPAGKMILTVLAGVAEFERALIVARTSEGRTAALKRGIRFGPPYKLTGNQVVLAREAIEGGRTRTEVARLFNIHPATLYRALKNPALKNP
jgi:DNA invertase Pin-like site-specific DNA recombinase